jgi:hypothetical protein
MGMKLKISDEVLNTEMVLGNIVRGFGTFSEKFKTDAHVNFSSIFLTGATGFVCSGILASLLKFTDSHVYCLGNFKIPQKFCKFSNL